MSIVKIDMHVHTEHSPDGKHSPLEFVRRARAIGLSGIAITDHNEIKGAKMAREHIGNIDDFVVIIGEEISTKTGHILAYFLDKKIEKGLSPEKAIERIHRQGGVAVAAHPARLPSGLPRSDIRKLNFDGVEILNSYSVSGGNRRARRLAEELNLGGTGGSDAHKPRKVGNAFTIFETDSLDLDALKECILDGKTRVSGTSLSYHNKIILELVTFFQWLKRGGEDI